MPLPGKALPDVRERMGVYTFDEEGAGDIVVGLRGEERGVWYERYGEKMGHAQVRRALKCEGMSDGDLDDWAVDLDSSLCSDNWHQNVSSHAYLYPFLQLSLSVPGIEGRNDGR